MRTQPLVDVDVLIHLRVKCGASARLTKRGHDVNDAGVVVRVTATFDEPVPAVDFGIRAEIRDGNPRRSGGGLRDFRVLRDDGPVNHACGGIDRLREHVDALVFEHHPVTAILKLITEVIALQPCLGKDRRTEHPGTVKHESRTGGDRGDKAHEVVLRRVHAAGEIRELLQEDFALPGHNAAGAVNRNTAMRAEEKIVRRKFNIVADPRDFETPVLAALQRNACTVVDFLFIEDDRARDGRVTHQVFVTVEIVRVRTGHDDAEIVRLCTARERELGAAVIPLDHRT